LRRGKNKGKQGGLNLREKGEETGIHRLDTVRLIFDKTKENTARGET
jgi:hypothetical protein